jgi:hypothetical protein
MNGRVSGSAHKLFGGRGLHVIGQQAKPQHRGKRSYISNIVIRAVEFEKQIMAKSVALNRSHCAAAVRAPGPRTVMLLRCSKDGFERIRRVAKIRDVTISGFVLHSLRRSWNIDQNLIQAYFGR